MPDMFHLFNEFVHDCQFKELQEQIDKNNTCDCENCCHIEQDPVFGLCCVHKASMEGIEAVKAFYTPNEIKECKYFSKN